MTSLLALKPYLLSVVPIAIAIGVYAIASQGLRRMVKSTWLTPTMAGRVRVLLRWFAMGAACVLTLQGLGLVNHAWAIITGTAAAVAVGFVAHWSILSNWASAVLILMYQRFGVGDEVEILETFDKPQGLRGIVRETNLMYTILEARAEDGQTLGEIQIPNNLFFQKATRIRRNEPAS